MLGPEDDGGSLDALKFSLASDIIELIVLTSDEAFLQTMRDAAGSARRLWPVPSGDKVSDLLVAGGVGIVVLDVQALIGPTKEFVAQIKRQFPDLVIVVAGNRDDETQLAGLISAGTIYRFIHKPMSPARARLFTEAAVRKYAEQRLRVSQLPLQRRDSNSSRGWLIGVALAIISGIAWFVWTQRSSGVDEVAQLPAVQSVTASTEPSLVSRAASALAANRLTAPPGDNALELYLQIQALNPGDVQARAGIAEVQERLLAYVQTALLKEHWDEAEQAIETARRSGVESARIAFFSAQLAKAHDQSKSAQPQLRVNSEIRTSVEPQSAGRQGAVERREPEVAAASNDAINTEVGDAGKAKVLEQQEHLQPERLQPASPIEPANNNAKLEKAASAVLSSANAVVVQQPVRSNMISSAQLTLLKSVVPLYPTKALAAKLQGWVELDFTIGERGEVKDIAVHGSSTPGIFDDAAIKAVSQWRYQAILQNGKPITARTRVRIRFADPSAGT